MYNISGYFISAGISTVPFIYTITPLRTGKSFLTLTVLAHQPTSPLPQNTSPCFTATISFKHPSPPYTPSSPTPTLSYQSTPAEPPLTRFAAILHHTHPRALPIRKYTDVHAVIADTSPTPHRSPSFPGLSWAQLPYAHNALRRTPDPHHAHPQPARRVTCNAYTARGGVRGDVNLAVCAHLFASDRETIYLAARHLGVRAEAARGTVASVSHKVVLHDLSWRGVGFPAGEEGDERWFVQEVETDRWADGRVVVRGRIVDVETGAHVASTLQDGVLKADFGGDEEAVERVREGFERGVVVEREERKTAKAKM
ncbi:hypothetical protein SLS57_012075 [Botryosphaeria dothidea]